MAALSFRAHAPPARRAVALPPRVSVEADRPGSHRADDPAGLEYPLLEVPVRNLAVAVRISEVDVRADAQRRVDITMLAMGLTATISMCDEEVSKVNRLRLAAAHS